MLVLCFVYALPLRLAPLAQRLGSAQHDTADAETKHISFIDRAHAVEQCEEPIRTFTTGPGRRPGATVVPVFMRQYVKNSRGEYVPAISVKELAKITGDQISIRVDVKNNSIYPVGNVKIQHAYRRVPEGPQMIDIVDVSGGTYIPHDHLFYIEKIRAGATAELTFTILLDGNLGRGIAQNTSHLHDFMVLDPSSRFPRRLPETHVSRSRSIVEKLGIGGKEVSCFSAYPDEVSIKEPEKVVVTARPVAPPPLPPTTVTTGTQTARTSDPSGIVGKLTIEKRVSDSTPRSGQQVLFSVIVHNGSSETFRDVLVDDRFDTRHFEVVEDGGGLSTSAGIQWLIEELKPGDDWSASYSVRVARGLVSGTGIPNTVSLFGEQLLDVPSSALSKSLELKIAGAEVIAAAPVVIETPQTVIMPMTGRGSVGLRIFEIVVGATMAIPVFWIGLRRLSFKIH